jgi:hypothetical protein
MSTEQQLAAWRAADERNERALSDLLAQQDQGGGAGAAGNEFVDSLLRYANRYGRLSDLQRDAVLRGIERRNERARPHRARDTAFADPAPAPVVEGRIEITGRLVALKTQASEFGDVTKMLVVDDRGFRVWGTFPAALTDPLFERARADGSTHDGIAGWLRAGAHARVRFTATVTRSRDDESFGFFKRPTKAAVVMNHYAEIREIPDWCGPSTWSAELDGIPVGKGYRSIEEAQAAVTAAMRERHDMIPAER